MQGLVQERERDVQRARVERAVLAGVILPDSKADPADPLGELAALAEAADVAVVDQLVQKRMKLATNSALGRGKLLELAELVRAQTAEVVIVDNDLSPRQIRGVRIRRFVWTLGRTRIQSTNPQSSSLRASFIRGAVNGPFPDGFHPANLRLVLRSAASPPSR